MKSQKDLEASLSMLSAWAASEKEMIYKSSLSKKQKMEKNAEINRKYVQMRAPIIAEMNASHNELKKELSVMKTAVETSIHEFHSEGYDTANAKAWYAYSDDKDEVVITLIIKKAE